MLSLEESLKHYTVHQLRKEIANYNKGVKITGYTKLQKSDLEKLILMNKSKFMHLVLEKAPEKKEVKKKEPTKKEEVKKAEPVKKEEIKTSLNDFKIISTKREDIYNTKKEEKEYFKLSDKYTKSNLLLSLDNEIKGIKEEILGVKKYIGYLDKDFDLKRPNGTPTYDKAYLKKVEDEKKYSELIIKYLEEEINIYEKEKNKINKLNLKTEEGSNILNNYLKPTEKNDKTNIYKRFILKRLYNYNSDNKLRKEMDDMKNNLIEKYKNDTFYLYHIQY